MRKKGIYKLARLIGNKNPDSFSHVVRDEMRHLLKGLPAETVIDIFDGDAAMMRKNRGTETVLLDDRSPPHEPPLFERPRCPICGAYLELIVTSERVIQICPSDFPSHHAKTLRDNGARFPLQSARNPLKTP